MEEEEEEEESEEEAVNVSQSLCQLPAAPPALCCDACLPVIRQAAYAEITAQTTQLLLENTPSSCFKRSIFTQRRPHLLVSQHKNRKKQQQDAHLLENPKLYFKKLEEKQKESDMNHQLGASCFLMTLSEGHRTLTITETQ